MSTVPVPNGLSLNIDQLRWPDVAAHRASAAQAVRRTIAARIFRQAVRRLPVRIEVSTGQVWGAGAADAPRMTLHRPDAFFGRVGADGLIGFGESYMAGDWDAPDLGGFLTELARELPRLVPEPLQKLRAAYVARIPAKERNIVGQTRNNIARHYDLSNDLFELFLDETLTYSSALFGSDASKPGTPTREQLAGAQIAKIDRLLDAAGVGEGSRVLEIGTGWGELCIRAANRGARVHSVTLSSEQQALARERVAAAGFSDQVTIDLVDYREVEGSYDAVVSVEMIEAVGYEFWPTYFRKIDSVLAPGGRAAIQAITMPHDRMLATRETYTWINKYIFPGGFLPSTEAIADVTTTHTSLRVSDRFSMGLHYAETLRLWDEAFLAARDKVLALDFDEVFMRMWHFYLEYSRAGFASRYLDVQQITLARPEGA